jgi:phenylalanyl-tRNA synthetase beta subunit
MCQLIETLHCGIVADGTIDILNFIPHERRISCTVDEINERCNTNFTDTALTALLQPTGISMEGNEFVIPAHRSDLISVADLMGEIIRLHNIQKLNICS